MGACQCCSTVLDLLIPPHRSVAAGGRQDEAIGWVV